MATVRRFLPSEAEAVSVLIRRTLLEINQGSDPQWEIDYLYAHYTPETILKNSQKGHTYVLEENGVLLGTGTIMEAGAGEGELLALFLSPEAVGHGHGAQLVRSIEADPLFCGSKRVWLTTSVMARHFYERMGYQYVGGHPNRDNPDGLVYMEKYPKR